MCAVTQNLYNAMMYLLQDNIIMPLLIIIEIPYTFEVKTNSTFVMLKFRTALHTHTLYYMAPVVCKIIT